MSQEQISGMELLTSLPSDAMIPVTSASSDPLKNYRYNLAAALAPMGLFTALSATAIPIAVTRVRTDGYRSVGKGGADYIYDAAVDSAFVAANPKWSFLAEDGRGFRLSEDQDIWFEMFGAYGDSDRVTAASGGHAAGTDDYANFVALLAFLALYKRTHGNAYYKSVPAVNFGRYDYRFSAYINLPEGVYTFKGAGPNAIDRGGNTGFVFDAGICGVVFQSWATAGITGSTSNTAKGSAYSHFEDISIFSVGGTVGATGTAVQHGFLVKAPVTFTRCFATGFGNHGFLIDSTTGGNANCGKLHDCGAAYNGRDGLKFVGDDSNAWEEYGFNAIYNQGWGIEEVSGLGNHYYGYHTQTNGNQASGPPWATAGERSTSRVHYGGFRYWVIPGQETGASTNAPTGAATNNTWWLYYDTGGTDQYYPTWSSGINVVAGGAFYVSGASNKSGIFGGYMESDQAVGYNATGKALILCGGFSAFYGGSQLNSNDSRLWAAAWGTTLASGGGIEITPTDLAFVSTSDTLFRVVANRLQLRGALDASVSWERQLSSDQHAYSMRYGPGIILGATNAGYAGVAASIPTTGSYTQGAWVRNTAGSISGGKVLLGWYRLTTGSGHVSGTDWTPIYGTTT